MVSASGGEGRFLPFWQERLDRNTLQQNYLLILCILGQYLVKSLVRTDSLLSLFFHWKLTLFRITLSNQASVWMRENWDEIFCDSFLARVSTAFYQNPKGVFTWHQGDFRPGASSLRSLSWLYICLHDTTTNFMLARVTPVPVPGREFHSGTKSRNGII